MGILEKFKSKKEQELKGDIVADAKVVNPSSALKGASEDKGAKKPAAKKPPLRRTPW